MIRNHPPYNGHRFLANVRTGEIHDLLRETPNCQIDEIKEFDMFDTYQSALIYMTFRRSELKPNGCYYCAPSSDCE